MNSSLLHKIQFRQQKLILLAKNNYRKRVRSNNKEIKLEYLNAPSHHPVKEHNEPFSLHQLLRRQHEPSLGSVPKLLNHL